MMKKLIAVLTILIVVFLFVCIFLYFFQEKFLFFPEHLSQAYRYTFTQPFEEKNYQVGEEVTLNALHFRAPDSKGIVFFLHGNGGALNRWGEGADLFTRNGYDVLYIDYRGYGKSNGKIMSETQMIDDAQYVYDNLKKAYTEDQIIITGTSMGTGIAVQLAAKNNPHKLILNSPYASLEQLIQEKFPVVPKFIIRYKLKSFQYLNQVKCPVYVFHGKEDTLIPWEHVQKFKDTDERVHLKMINGFGHNDLSESTEYQQAIWHVLKED